MAQAKLLPAYLVVGEDEFKRSQVIDRLRSRLEATGMADFNLDERDMTRDPQIDDIIASLNTLPMGTDFRLVILEGCDRLPKALSEPLVEYLAKPSATTVCMIVATKLSKATRLYKAIAAIDSKAVIDCSPKKAWELPKWVVKMVGARGKKITPDAAEELVSRVGTDSRMLDNQVGKLVAMVEGPDIKLSDVEAHVARTAEVKPWDLLNAMSARDLPKTLELLEMQPEHSEMRLYALLVARLRELIVAKALDARGQGRELANRLGMQGWQVKNHLAWSRRYQMGELTDALARAADLELALKGSRDSDLALRLWLIGLLSKQKTH